MAYTVEIPKQEWFSYFELLSERAVSHPVRISVEASELGDQILNRRLPLMGIDVETKGPSSGSIEVTLGDMHQEFMHHVDAPTQVFLMMDDSGNIDCICMMSDDESKTLLFFEGEEKVQAWYHSEQAKAEEHMSGL
ncbi:DUF5335 family protein [Melittangium boletus]|uniref:Uncharacterized protein n=1 Tax=Melittangium boletus DSM 14713 TaxID=1294270 RepID=A0A250IK31_9BACT|nr:DUF5335 family protein [Melittangium boletus]ATB31266.1 hypothetical protein MEBOL_004728 [Melittangium boletus DSM 14713]